MSDKILLGYEMQSVKAGIAKGDPVEIPLSHLIVTGITQLSGKTTTLEALIKRSGKRAVVFKTKIGEKGFSEGKEIAPFFKDRSDYEFVKSLIEAYAKEKLYLEKGTLMKLCKGSKDLIEIKKKVDEILIAGKIRGIKEEICIRLQHYLENLIPQIQYANLSRTLNLVEGINIVNLERFSPEAQSLIIEATTWEVLTTLTDTIIVIPEAWKFIPQKYSNPCKRAVEAFIRQGATNGNYLWIDSQDMAGVDKTPLKQISTWILGFQKERNEVKHTLDEIPLPRSQKPDEDEIMTLRIGQFFVTTYDFVKKVYVQPVWMDSETAIKIAKGEMGIEEIVKPAPPSTSIKKPIGIIKEPNMDEELIIQKVLERLPKTKVDIEEIITKVLARIPVEKQATVYQIAPLEMIKKDFLKETKDRIFTEIKELSPEHLKIIKFIEATGKGISQTELVSRCFFLSSTSGSSRQKVLNLCKKLASIQLIRKDKNNTAYPNLRERIKDLLQFHGATDKDIEQVYQHILVEILDKDGK